MSERRPCGSRSAWIAATLAATLLAAAPGTFPAEPVRLRFAQFNIWELSRAKAEAVDAEGRGADRQLRKAAEIVQRIRPDVLLINEIDGDCGPTARLFLERYLAVGQRGQRGLEYPYLHTAPVNTGQPSGLDLDHNGRRGDPEDAFGFGRYPGEFGMALYSKHPLEGGHARTFQRLLWREMPGHNMPDGRGGRPAWYTAEEAAVLRLSSKSHWDVPVRIGDARVHVLAAHPTPQVFDGPEDRNGRRNFDEIRLQADYVREGGAGGYLVDDAGRRGGLPAEALFVVMGDMNADPARDPAPYGRKGMDQLLSLPRVQDPAPESPGAVEGGPSGPPEFRERRTSDYGRADYVLPSTGLAVVDAGVFWPAAGDPLRPLVDEPHPASDHRLVWVEVSVPSNVR
jgi:endonuclease/exonuclease/phosphatase family metal-dependent hydrolase